MPASPSPPGTSLRVWGICGLLLLATMINYMDRLTLNLMARRIKVEFANNDNRLYGGLETGFGLAFAAGSIFSGLMVDRFGARRYYPLMVLLWSSAGFATGFARSYEELLVCRTLLGFFEAANWPCALYTTQRLLRPDQRTMGNGILQSGAALGAILTPLIVAPFLIDQSHVWRYPFLIVGAIGALWVVLWLALIGRDTIPSTANVSQPVGGSTLWAVYRDRRFWLLALVVVAINATWHFFRAWMPLFLQEQHGYSERFTTWFNMAYYVATDVGSLSAGLLTLLLVGRGLSVHRSRMTTYLLFSLLLLLTLVTPALPTGWLLLGVFLVIGFAALAVFPTYYSFTQELSAKHQGKVTGSLGCICWVAVAAMQLLVGWVTRVPEIELGRRLIPVAGSVVLAVDGPAADYTLSIALAGVPPILAFAALLLFWKSPRTAPSPQLPLATDETAMVAAPS